jgi:hypothetical protein
VDRSPSLLLSDLRCRGFSAATKFSLCCRSSSLTGTAFPPPDLREFRVWLRFPGAFGTMRSSDSCWVIGFRLCILRPTAFAEPSSSRWVMPKDFATTSSPLRTWYQRILGFVAGGRLAHHARLTALRFHSKQSRTYGFFRTPPHGSPQILTNPGSTCHFRPAPLPHRCRIPFVRAPGQDLRLNCGAHLRSLDHASHTSSTMPPHRLRRAALHLPLRRPERGLLYFHHGLLVCPAGNRHKYFIARSERLGVQQFAADSLHSRSQCTQWS